MTQIATDVPVERWPGIMADVAAAVGRRDVAVRQDVYHVILREIPQLRDDKPLLALAAGLPWRGWWRSARSRPWR